MKKSTVICLLLAVCMCIIPAACGSKKAEVNGLGVGIKDADTASVTLSERAKYKNIQEARDISYSDERGEYTTDEEFANFRCVTVGNIKDGVFYRAASPCDNQHNRAPYVDALIEKANVSRILDLAAMIKAVVGDSSADLTKADITALLKLLTDRP